MNDHDRRAARRTRVDRLLAELGRSLTPQQKRLIHVEEKSLYDAQGLPA